jgi:hypothetical protein
MKSINSAPKYSSVTIKIHVPQEDIRAFRDPNGLGRKWYMCQIPVDAIHNARIEFGPNPRNQNIGTKVFEGIQNTLAEKPAWFLYYSKGIVVNADEASYDNSTEDLSFRLRRNDDDLWNSPGGNADGGHLQRAIFDALNGIWKNSDKPSERAYVKLEVLTGIADDELDELVGARNTNLQVDELSLAVLGDKLDWLIDVLDAEGVNREIAWRQFEKGKEIRGQDVIASLSLINPAFTEKERLRCYSGPGKLIQDLRHDDQLMAGLIGCKQIAFEWLQFVDYLHASFEQWYDQSRTTREGEDRKSGFGNLKGITIRDHKLVFLRKEIRYSAAKPWVLPVAGAFAQLAHAEKPEEWRAIADIVGPVLLDRIIEFTNAERNNLNAVGKRQYVWGSLASEVKSVFADRRLARAVKT